ncbi:MAG: hypothetical protein WA192_09305 [Candidatus Acidiferrales bacterium]
MRRASKRFWLLVSVLAGVGAMLQAGPVVKRPPRVNELTLAGLRPGSDKMAAPAKEFRDLSLDPAASDAYVWGDICTHRELRVETDAGHVVKTVSVDSYYKREVMAKCAASAMEPQRLKRIATGHGLQLGDACGRVAAIYGKPESQSPSVKGSDKLELYLYTFDWAGPDVPQVMEVSCDAASQTVTEIMLAAASL